MVNPSTDKKILDFKTFADGNFSVIHLMHLFYDGAGNIVGKGENGGYKDSSFSRMFSKGFFPKVIMMLLKVNPLPTCKILDVTKYNAFSDNKLNIAKINISLFDRMENTVERWENAGHQHFLLSPQCLPKPLC